MTFLILKIAVYLTVALVLGIAAGWVSRHVTAQRETETSSRALNDNRAKVPQLESLIRVRDDEIQRIKQAHQGQEESVSQATQELQAQVSLVRDKEVEVARLKAQLDSLQSMNIDTADDMSMMIPAEDAASTPIVDGELVSADDLTTELLSTESVSTDSNLVESEMAEPSTAHLEQIAFLEARIEVLERELTEANFAADTAQADNSIRDEMEELTKRLRQKAQDFDRLNRQMEGEKRKVSELERERELQNKSLQVLHQQLEMERNRVVVPVSAD